MQMDDIACDARRHFALLLYSKYGQSHGCEHGFSSSIRQGLKGIGTLAVLYANLALVYLTALCSRWFVKSPLIETPPKPNALMAAFTMAIMILVAGLQKNIGDTVFYIHAYNITDFTWEHIISNKDKGFNLFQMLLQSVSREPQVLIFVVALITNVLILIPLYQYSRMFELSLFVYITSGMYISSMNGIRQFMAAAIAFAATKFIINGDWKKYIVVILIAAQLHQSALVLIPIYFIVRRKAWSWTTMALLVGSIFIVLGFNQFTSMLFSVLENNQYGQYKAFSEGGANILRVAVSGAPLLVAFLGREKLKTIFPHSDIFVNMSLLSFVFMLISTQNWIFARFTFYFSAYSCVLVSYLIHLFAKREQKLVYFAVVVCYFIYFFYDNYSIQLQYRSDYINFM